MLGGGDLADLLMFVSPIQLMPVWTGDVIAAQQQRALVKDLVFAGVYSRRSNIRDADGDIGAERVVGRAVRDATEKYSQQVRLTKYRSMVGYVAGQLFR